MEVLQNSVDGVSESVQGRPLANGCRRTGTLELLMLLQKFVASATLRKAKEDMVRGRYARSSNCSTAGGWGTGTRNPLQRRAKKTCGQVMVVKIIHRTFSRIAIYVYLVETKMGR